METLTVKKIGIYIFGFCLSILTLTAILGIWGVVDPNVAWKSALSFGIIAFSSLLFITIYDRIYNKKD